MRLKLVPDPRLYAWVWEFLKNCTAGRARENTARKLRLCLYSQAQLREVTAREGLSYDGIARGLLYLYRDQASLDRGTSNMFVLTENGLPLQTLDRAETIALEPALAGFGANVVGSIYCPSDESGDAHIFTRLIYERCLQMGVAFKFDVDVKAIAAGADTVDHIETAQGRLVADRYVLAMGSHSPLLARKLGYRLPVYPVKGVFGDLPDRAARKSARCRRHRRGQSHRLGPFGRPSPLHRDGGIRRLRHGASAERLHPHAAGREGTVPGGGRLFAAEPLGRAAADDAERHAPGRGDPPPQPVPQHRTRTLRLDDVMWNGAPSGRRHAGTDARTRHGGTQRPLRGRRPTFDSTRNLAATRPEWKAPATAAGPDSAFVDAGGGIDDLLHDLGAGTIPLVFVRDGRCRPGVFGRSQRISYRRIPIRSSDTSGQGWLDPRPQSHASDPDEQPSWL